MLNVYINYPNSTVSVHHNRLCQLIRANRKQDQRICRIDTATVSMELERFRTRHYRFQSTSQWNDMWLEIDFQDDEFEEAVARHVLRLLGTRYRPFDGISIKTHC